MHIIPWNGEVERYVGTVRPGQTISLRGKLVTVRGPDRWGWTSSLTRLDSGERACEVFFVEHAAVIGPARVIPRSDPVKAPPVSLPVSRPSPEPVPATTRLVLAGEKTFPIPCGTLTIPAGEAIQIVAKNSSQVKVVHRGVAFWIERGELE